MNKYPRSDRGFPRIYGFEADFGYTLGGDAFQSGIGVGGNPFNDDEEAVKHTKWIDGWNAAKDRTFAPPYRVLP